MHEAQTYEPFAGPITLDSLDELLAHHRARFAGFTMEKDDDGDDDAEDELEVDDDGDENDDDAEDDDAEDDEKLGEAGKKALIAERARNKELRRKLREATQAGKKRDQGDDDRPRRRRSRICSSGPRRAMTPRSIG